TTTQNLPMLFYIEDNKYGISVPRDFQTPGGNIAKNLYSFKNIRIFDGDGTDPDETLDLLSQSVSYVRERKGPVLIHLTMPRLNGHSYQDNQAYKGEEYLKKEQENDPLKNIKEYLISDGFTRNDWNKLHKSARETVSKAVDDALNRAEPDPSQTTKYVFAETNADGTADHQQTGG